jgi:hypothetical protein
MEQQLRITIREAIEFENKTGVALTEWVQEAAKNPAKVKMADMFLIYKLGSGIPDDEEAYTAFDKWDADLAKKLEVIGNAIGDYFKKKQKQ